MTEDPFQDLCAEVVRRAYLEATGRGYMDDGDLHALTLGFRNHQQEVLSFWESDTALMYLAYTMPGTDPDRVIETVAEEVGAEVKPLERPQPTGGLLEWQIT